MRGIVPRVKSPNSHLFRTPLLGGMDSPTGQYAHLVAGTDGGPLPRRHPQIHKESAGIIPDAYGMLSCFQGAQP